MLKGSISFYYPFFQVKMKLNCF
uniref:Uncharacterized protein n=1 Tax=Rhizophora mucronata TaxID=61149 RepID=A0A2P2N1H3_RHIMU